VRFARVRANGRVYTSALDAPSLPSDLAQVVLGVQGLQPHLVAPRAPIKLQPRLFSSAPPPYSPAQILNAYNGSGPATRGSGQTIAIISDSFPVLSDLALFAANSGYATPTVTEITIGAGPSASYVEPNIDTQWASAMAPAAKLRVYGTADFSSASIDQALSKIYADAATDSTLAQVSMSFGISDELHTTIGQLQATQQLFATLTAAGISLFASSGDAGSQPGTIENGAIRINDPSLPAEVQYPASDPNVIAVGGTTLALNSASSLVCETTWSLGAGGLSTLFNRPAWQTAAGLASGPMRAIPDVAFDANPDTGVVVFYEGAEYSYGGTSVGSPAWAGICAAINQARVTAKLAVLGSVGPKLYPLQNSSAFGDITSGSNGLFAAGPGFDLCSGLGVPNIDFLITALSGGAASAARTTILNRGGTLEIAPGAPATIPVEAVGPSALSYAWQRLPAGSEVWNYLVDNAAYSGTATTAMTIGVFTSDMSGDQFRCVATSGGVSVAGPATSVVPPAAGAVVTVAGVLDNPGFADGPAARAQFNEPWGIVADAAGNIYVADSENDVIRKITPAGTVSTFAGISLDPGMADGVAGTGVLNLPEGLAIDAAGNLYVADTGNNAVRKIDPHGTITTVAGNGVAGSADGTGAAGRFSAPRGIAVDAAGNLYVGDTGNNTVRRVSPVGVVTTLAGLAGAVGAVDGKGSAARFSAPRGVAVDAQGNVVVIDTGNSAVRKVAPDGTTVTFAGSLGYPGDQPGTGGQGRFLTPYGVAIDAAGNLYVTDEYADAVRKVDPQGVIRSFAGLPESIGFSDGSGASARLYGPWGVAVDPTGAVLVTDAENGLIRRIVAPVEVAVGPSNQTVAAGAAVTFSVTAAGTAPAYQWLFNGVPIAGATQATLTLTNVGTSAAGQYSVTVANSLGTVTSGSALLTVASPTTRLVNFSARASVGTGGNTLALGFATAGGSKRVLVRGVGPALSLFGVVSALPALELTLYNGSGGLVDLDEGWGGGAELSQVFAQVGAFPLPVTTYDSAVLDTLPAGVYSAQVAALLGTNGNALAELYDADVGITPARFVNVSARGFAGAGANALLGGFVVAGSGTETVLVRGIGPSLGGVGIPGALAAVQLTLYDHAGNVVASNAGWGGSAALASAFSQVGAFSLPSGSADSALVAMLAPGQYSAQVNGPNGTTGVGLLEIYELADH